MATNCFRVQRNRKNDITRKLDDSSRTNRNVNNKHFLVKTFFFFLHHVKKLLKCRDATMQSLFFIAVDYFIVKQLR